MRLPAFLTRRKETTVPETATAETPAPSRDVVMQFLTQGGATVDLYRRAWSAFYYARANAKDVDFRGFQWQCNGCDTTGAAGRYRLQTDGYDEHEPRESREHANEHAEKCRALPKPTA